MGLPGIPFASIELPGIGRHTFNTFQSKIPLLLPDNRRYKHYHFAHAIWYRQRHYQCLWRRNNWYQRRKYIRC